jgi:hypothetical protein
MEVQVSESSRREKRSGRDALGNASSRDGGDGKRVARGHSDTVQTARPGNRSTTDGVALAATDVLPLAARRQQQILSRSWLSHSSYNKEHPC